MGGVIILIWKCIIIVSCNNKTCPFIWSCKCCNSCHLNSSCSTWYSTITMRNSWILYFPCCKTKCSRIVVPNIPWTTNKHIFYCAIVWRFKRQISVFTYVNIDFFFSLIWVWNFYCWCYVYKFWQWFCIFRTIFIGYNNIVSFFFYFINNFWSIFYFLTFFVS